MAKYTIGNTAKLLDWIGAHPGEMDRCDALLTWAGLVCVEPEGFAHGHVTNTATGRRFLFSDVPGAMTRVTFGVFESPVRAVWIMDIDDRLFQVS